MVDYTIAQPIRCKSEIRFRGLTCAEEFVKDQSYANIRALLQVCVVDGTGRSEHLNGPLPGTMLGMIPLSGYQENFGFSVRTATLTGDQG